MDNICPNSMNEIQSKRLDNQKGDIMFEKLQDMENVGTMLLTDLAHEFVSGHISVTAYKRAIDDVNAFIKGINRIQRALYDRTKKKDLRKYPTARQDEYI